MKLNLQDKRENSHPESRDLKHSKTFFAINIVQLFKEIKEEVQFIMGLEHFYYA